MTPLRFRPVQIAGLRAFPPCRPKPPRPPGGIVAEKGNWHNGTCFQGSRSCPDPVGGSLLRSFPFSCSHLVVVICWCWRLGRTIGTRMSIAPSFLLCSGFPFFPVGRKKRSRGQQSSPTHLQRGLIRAFVLSASSTESTYHNPLHTPHTPHTKHTTYYFRTPHTLRSHPNPPLQLLCTTHDSHPHDISSPISNFLLSDPLIFLYTLFLVTSLFSFLFFPIAIPPPVIRSIRYMSFA